MAQQPDSWEKLAAQMRREAKNWDDPMRVTQEIWEAIAARVEALGKEMEKYKAACGHEFVRDRGREPEDDRHQAYKCRICGFERDIVII